MAPPVQQYQGPNPEKIHQMFGAIARRYDLANTILSAGIHHLWRRSLVRWSETRSGHHILDCATGTGDLAIEFGRTVAPNGSVKATDFCAEMMLAAPEKAARAGCHISFSQADVMNLPFTDQSFDVSSIAFGIRNVNDPSKAISELGRVTRPGGFVMILEFGQPTNPLIAKAYNFYSNRILPRLGGLVTGNAKAYEYLQNSSAQFPCRDEFATLIRNTGRFTHVEWRPLSMGIAYIYKAQVA